MLAEGSDAAVAGDSEGWGGGRRPGCQGPFGGAVADTSPAASHDVERFNESMENASRLRGLAS